MALQGERRWDDYPSVGCADSSPDKGSQGAVEDAGPYKLGQKCSPLFTGFFAALRMTANFEALRAATQGRPYGGRRGDYPSVCPSGSQLP